VLSRLEDAACALERLESDPAPRLDVLADGAARPVDVSALECLHDPAVLGDEVRMALDVPAPDDLHHQVHRELAVEAGEQRVSGEVDLVLVEGRVRRVPLPVRDGVGRRVEERAERLQLGVPQPPDRALGGVELEREADVVPLCQRDGRGLRETPSSSASTWRLNFSPGLWRRVSTRIRSSS
jgi:hypothetical protein